MTLHPWLRVAERSSGFPRIPQSVDRGFRVPIRLSGGWLGDLDGIFMVSTSGRHDGGGTVYIPRWGMLQVLVRDRSR